MNEIYETETFSKLYKTVIV